MFSIPKDIQTTFIHSPIVYKDLIPKDTILYRINQKIDFSFVNEACSDLYSPDKGRPVKNTPERMFRSIDLIPFFSTRCLQMLIISGFERCL